MPLFLTRNQVEDAAWDRCVAGAHNALLYGHTWYLDAVTNLPDWKWEGLVVNLAAGRATGASGQGQSVHYHVVLPIPLRRRWGQWVVYQPLFCQFLAVFSKQPIDPTPLLQAVYERYKHASKWHLLLEAPCVGLPVEVRQRVMYTHVLPIVGEAVSREPSYTADRRMNLRRAARRMAQVPDWQLAESADMEPLLALFQENHAAGIGVGDWAYTLFRGVFRAIQQRGLGSLYYARAGGQVVAGVLFVEQHGRIIYLFNAANAEGRRLNARAVLIDQLIQKKQTQLASEVSPPPLLLDFESPEKPGVVSFYESFGATPQPYVVLSWNRLTWIERLGKWVLKLNPDDRASKPPSNA